jgi:hypothetical protein
MISIIIDTLSFAKNIIVDVIAIIFSGKLAILLAAGVLCYFFRSRIKTLVIKAKNLIVNKVKSIFKKEK